MTDPSAAEASAPVVVSASASVPRCYPGRWYLKLGLALPALGVLGYVAQLWAQRLWVPWYMPFAATVGVVLLIVALWRARTLWRVLALVLVGLLAAAEWTLLLMPGLPAYTGPVRVGQPFPAFTTMRADGTAFTQRDLTGNRNAVMVFFRGRW
jgi:hypothetical protein